MSKVTSKYQVTIPRAIARAHGIEPGSAIVFESAGEVIRVRMEDEAGRDGEAGGDRASALRWFDVATERQLERNARVLKRTGGVGGGRGWTREDLYPDLHQVNLASSLG